MLQIVPDRGILTVDARISPADVDQLHAGQDAKVNFSAFNRQTTPEIHGVLGLVSAKPIEDPRTGRSYYQARIDLPQTERSEEHTSELQSLMRNSYAVFCLKK